MSQPRLHQLLQDLFDRKDNAQLGAILGHEEYFEFMGTHELKLPVEELVQAFTHTSFHHEYRLPHQEQLEFLGDSVLQLILTEELFRLFPQEKEGRLSKLRSSLVNEKSLATIARGLGVGELLLVGKGEFKKGLMEQEVVLADTLEALLAQVYRHHGLDFTRRLMLGWLTEFIPDAFDWEKLNDFDAKSKLQELSLKKYKKLPRYSSQASGENFEIGLWINEECVARGIFPSKKAGEKELAQEVIKKGMI